jgi:hypothetical protein
MKKIKEYKKKKLSIKFPSVTLTAKVDDDINLKKGDHIKLQMGQKLEMFGIVTTSQCESGKNIDMIEVDEVDSVEKSKIKEVFIL